jgi:integrase
MLALGVPHPTIQEALGHSSPMVTLGTYTHVPVDLLQEAAGRLGRAFGTG